MTHPMQRIAGFVARPGAQQGKKVLCVQCMQRIAGFVARVWAKIGKMAYVAQRIDGFCTGTRP
jgi:hypothetical protein